MGIYSMFKKTIQHPNNINILLDFEAIEEYADPRAQNYAEDVVRGIEKAIGKGNQAAWFTARATARIAGTEVKSSPQYLGCCSYSSFEEFLDSEMFLEMSGDATNELINNLDKHLDEAIGTVARIKQLKGSI